MSSSSVSTRGFVPSVEAIALGLRPPRSETQGMINVPVLAPKPIAESTNPVWFKLRER